MTRNIDIDLLQYESSLARSTVGGREYVYDPVRKRKILLGPEEFVRQLLIQHLLSDDDSSIRRMAVEKQFKLNRLVKRFDILIYNKSMKPHTLIECKAPHHKLTQKDLDQMINYNITMEAPYLILSNGLLTKAWHISPMSKVKALKKLELNKLFN